MLRCDFESVLHRQDSHLIANERGGGAFATSAASLVAEGVQRVGLVPVWTTTDDDFAEVSRRTMISVAPQGL